MKESENDEKRFRGRKKVRAKKARETDRGVPSRLTRV